MSTDAHFWVKLKNDFKFQSLGKISNISAADPPPRSFLGQFQHCLQVVATGGVTKSIQLAQKMSDSTDPSVVFYCWQ